MRFELRTSLIAAIYFVHILIHLAGLYVSSQNCLITNLNEENEVNNMFIPGTGLQCSISEKKCLLIRFSTATNSRNGDT